MKRFKNQKAQELFEEADELERHAEKLIEKNNGIIDDFCGELLTMAAGLRVEADEIETGHEEDFER